MPSPNKKKFGEANNSYYVSVWQETTVQELKALSGINIFMGLNPLPQYKLYFYQNDFIDISGVKKNNDIHKIQKLTQCLDVSDEDSDPAQNNADYDPLYKIHPVLNMVWDSFAESYQPGQNQTIDEDMIAYKGRHSYVKYLPAKPIKRGIKVLILCFTDTAYVHQFDLYLGWQQNSLILALDMMWWWNYVRIFWERKSHHVYCDNQFTSIQFLKDLLACKTYCSGTIWVNKKYLP